MQNDYDISFERSAEQTSARMAFIKKTYLNLAAAFAVFVALEATLLHWQPAVELASKMVDGSNWLIVLLAFMGVSWLANKWAATGASLGAQLAGLYLYVAAEAVIFLPILLVAEAVAPDAIGQAAILTASLAGGITSYVFISGKRFSYLGSFLAIAGFVALGTIVCAILFGFQLGLWFSIAMAVFAAAAVLYNTGEVLHGYESDQYVAAALSLFASIALLFWYILRILLDRR